MMMKAWPIIFYIIVFLLSTNDQEVIAQDVHQREATQSPDYRTGPHARGGGKGGGGWDHYIGVQDLSSAEVNSLAAAVINVPLHRYRFLYDTVGNNKQRLGPLPYETQGIIPEALRPLQGSDLIIFHSSAIHRHHMEPQCLLKEVTMVDPNILFMYSLAATKALIARTAQITSRIAEAVEISLNRNWTKGIDTSVNGQACHLPLFDLRAACEALEMDVTSLHDQMNLTQDLGHLRLENLDHRFLLLSESLRRKKKREVPSHFDEHQIDSVAERREAGLNHEVKAEEESIDIEEGVIKSVDDAILVGRWNLEKARVKAEIQRSVDTLRLEIQEEARHARLNQELVLERLAVKAEEDRIYAREILYLISTTIQDGVMSISSGSCPGRLLGLFFALLLICVGTLVSHDLVLFARNFLEKRFDRPQFVRRGNRPRRAKKLKGLKGWEIDGGDKQWLDGLVLHTATEIALKEEIKSIQRARKQGLAFRNLLVLGPSGNGKSKLVRLLADESGLDCAIVNASNFGPWGGSAAAELHTLFAWARHSSKGLMVVIEEAEIALGDRTRLGQSEWRSSLLNAILCYSSEPSTRYMLVLVTNRGSDLDAAILDRMDRLLLLSPPDIDQRSRLLDLYLHRYIGQCGWNTQSSSKDRVLKELAMMTNGLSCREIEKVAIAVQGEYLSREGNAGKLPEGWFETELKKRANDLSGRRKGPIGSEVIDMKTEERDKEGRGEVLKKDQASPPKESTGAASSSRET